MYVDAIHRMIQDGVPPNNGTALLHYLYNSTINGVTGTMNIDSVCQPFSYCLFSIILIFHSQNGNRIGMYELDNWNGTTYKKVALWDSATGVTIVNPIIWMGNGSKPVDILPVCGIGSFLFLNASGPFCGKCLPGSYNPITGATSCLPCPVGSYTADYGNDQCISCAPGFFQAAEGATSCSICEIGRYSSSPQSVCQICIMTLGLLVNFFFFLLRLIAPCVLREHTPIQPDLPLVSGVIWGNITVERAKFRARNVPQE